MISAATLPFQLSSVTVSKRRFDQIHYSERIRALSPTRAGEGLSEEQSEAAFKSATKRMLSFAAEEEGVAFFRDKTVLELNLLLDNESLASAANELLHQALISTWSIFENFASTFIRCWINANPMDARKVLMSPDLQKFLGRQTVDIADLYEHGLDLSQSMGDVLFKGKRLDNLPVIRATMEALFESADIRSSLGDDLWSLNQRRHLIVHRRGIVDQEFREKTGSQLNVGERLLTSADDVEMALKAVVRAMVSIVRQADQQV